VLDYCRRSANPVGRLLLHLFKRTSDSDLRRADAICTALQLVNFWQDVDLDYRKDRIYRRRTDGALRVRRHLLQVCDAAWGTLMRSKCNGTG
jgi:phytoene/squalene synthetase